MWAQKAIYALTQLKVEARASKKEDLRIKKKVLEKDSGCCFIMW